MYAMYAIIIQRQQIHFLQNEEESSTNINKVTDKEQQQQHKQRDIETANEASKGAAATATKKKASCDVNDVEKDNDAIGTTTHKSASSNNHESAHFKPLNSISQLLSSYSNEEEEEEEELDDDDHHRQVEHDEAADEADDEENAPDLEEFDKCVEESTFQNKTKVSTELGKLSTFNQIIPWSLKFTSNVYAKEKELTSD